MRALDEKTTVYYRKNAKIKLMSFVSFFPLRKCICSGERQLGTGDLKTHQVEIDELNLPEKAKLLSTGPSTCNEPTTEKLTKTNCRLNNPSIASSVLKSRELLQSYKSRRTRSLERNHRHLVNIDPSNKR